LLSFALSPKHAALIENTIHVRGACIRKAEGVGAFRLKRIGAVWLKLNLGLAADRPRDIFGDLGTRALEVPNVLASTRP